MTKPQVVGRRAIVTVRDGRSLRGVLAADRTVFMADAHLHDQVTQNSPRQEVFGAKDILVWWEEQNR